MGKIYKKMFMRTKCSYCGNTKVCEDIIIVEDPAGNMKICQDCYKKLYKQKGWVNISKIGGVK